jgi:hypothetical protein
VCHVRESLLLELEQSGCASRTNHEQGELMLYISESVRMRALKVARLLSIMVIVLSLLRGFISFELFVSVGEASPRKGKLTSLI